MKAKVRQELKNSDILELHKKLSNARARLFEAILEHKQFKLKNTRSLTNLRKEIAVIQTLIKEKEMRHGKNA